MWVLLHYNGQASSPCVVLRAEITTGLDTTDDAGRERPVQKAKMEIIMVKTPQFDSLMEASSSGQQQQQGGSSDSPDPPAGTPPDAPPDASSAPPSASQVACPARSCPRHVTSIRPLAWHAHPRTIPGGDKRAALLLSRLPAIGRIDENARL